MTINIINTLQFELAVETQMHFNEMSVKSRQPGLTLAALGLAASAYWSIKVGDTYLRNSIWSYAVPLPEAYKIKDCLCFFNEKVDAIYLNNDAVTRENHCIGGASVNSADKNALGGQTI